MEAELRIQCKECGEIKHFAEFYKYISRNRKHKIRGVCRVCLKSNRRKIYSKEYPWYYSWEGAKNRCNHKTNTAYKWYGGRGIKMLLIFEEVRNLWDRDKAFGMKKPSLDRIDSKGNYIFENCRFIELPENVRRAISKNLKNTLTLV